MKTYEVVLFENKDRTEKYVQVWYQGVEKPYYFGNTYAKIFKWRLPLGKIIFGTDFQTFYEGIKRSKRVDTEKFPDLEKIKKHNESLKEELYDPFWG